MLHIVLYEPEIPQNTGAIMRLCANMGAALHLVHPLGYELDDKKLRRAGMDYRDIAVMQEHDNLTACLNAIKPNRVYACSTRSSSLYTKVKYHDNDALVFGPETRGLPQEMIDNLPPEQRIRIPMRPNNRSLNLANAVSVIAYEAWRQLDFVGGQ